MADLRNALASVFSPRPASEASLGSGLAEMAKTATQQRPYKLYVQEAEANGETPMSYEEWVKKNQG